MARRWLSPAETTSPWRMIRVDSLTVLKGGTGVRFESRRAQDAKNPNQDDLHERMNEWVLSINAQCAAPQCTEQIGAETKG